ncbi:MAG: hypothetical protein ACREOG_04340, partial [Gemmatimonadaceae bacterium]
MSSRVITRTSSIALAVALSAPTLTIAAQARTVEAPPPATRASRARVTTPTLTAAVDAAHFKGLK